MSELNANPKPKQNRQQSYSKKQKQDKELSFTQSLIIGASEWSKKLSLIDTLFWFVLSAALIALTAIFPVVAQYMTNIFTTTTTAFISLRVAYTTKSGFENVQKIKTKLGLNFEQKSNSLAINELEKNIDEGEQG